MTSSKAVQRPQRDGEPDRKDADSRVSLAMASRQELNAVRLAMTLPRRPGRGNDAHARAIERLGAAVDDLGRSSEASAAAMDGPDERSAAVGLAWANEQLAAREAWVKYLERGC